ncbi:uncharacterized protein [Asterias amurensis]|uniref:uncharacterized protein isoform X2 n=1 Tax=Asterias amurensis TaxID=7602 RepID=UPI003AB87B08
MFRVALFFPVAIALLVSLVDGGAWTASNTAGTTGSLQGHYHAWWAIVQLPKSTVEKMLPTGRSMVLEEISLPGLLADHHPVVLEIGTEHDVGPVGFPKWILMKFPEFKLDIPFVSTAPSSGGDTHTSLNYKSIVYTDSKFLSFSSRFQYNLNAKKAAIKMTDTTYDLTFEGKKFTASFDPSGEFTSPENFSNFSVYQNIMSQTWFGSYNSNKKTCANHYYQFDSIQVRPASMTMQAQTGVLDVNFPDIQINTPSVTEALGTVEVRL